MHAARRFVGVAAVLALAATAALTQTGPAVPAASPTGGARIFTGEAKPLGHGRINTWVTLDSANKPLALGVTFTEGALTGLPDTMPYTETVLAFPPQAAAAGLPFTHFVVNWNPKGHFPQQVYGAPHFDFHFYTITAATRQAMTLQGENRALQTPPEAAVPPGYMTVPGAEEAHMGVHWVDGSTPELHGTPFTQTFVYGYYAGQLAFLEPMATASYLRTGPSFTAPIKIPAVYPAAGYYPTQYSIRSDPRAKTYAIALEGFVLRTAGTAPLSSAAAPPACPPR